MQRLTRIAVLVLLAVSCTCGQDEDFIGLPVDFDIFGFDETEDNFFKEKELKYHSNTDTASDDLLRKLCEEYDLELRNEKLDCRNIKTVPKTLTHSLQKREAAEDTLAEGSGEPDQSPSETQDAAEVQESAPEVPPGDNHESIVPYEESAPAPEEEKAAENQEPPAPEETNNESSITTNEETSQKESNQESQSNVEETPENEGKFEQTTDNKESPVDENIEHKAEVNNETQENPAAEGTNEEAPAQPPAPQDNAESNNEGQEQQPTTIAAVPYEENNTPAANNAEENTNSEDKASENPDANTKLEEAQTTVEEVAVTEASVEQETTVAVVKKGRILKPNANSGTNSQDNENVKEESNKTNEENESEKVHEHQSGNAVINNPGSETLEGSEGVVKKMAPLENMKESSNSDLPQSGESSEETQQGRKDTKVLIVLLVAVVVIGGAAFAYNFIKKRKQKKSEAARSENGGSSALQRSASADKDPERGTEMKPLMKSAEQKPVVEYTDEKDNPKIEVTN